MDGRPTAVVGLHPGATDPRRRWPTARFGEVAAACAAEGCRVLVLGAKDEQGTRPPSFLWLRGVPLPASLPNQSRANRAARAAPATRVRSRR